MNTHLSQPTGAGAFDGQHGMSFAISSAVADDDISSAITCIEASEVIAVITGRETGAKARPAIKRTASSRRMAKLRFTYPVSHKVGAKERLPPSNTYANPNWPTLIDIKLPAVTLRPDPVHLVQTLINKFGAKGSLVKEE